VTIAIPSHRRRCISPRERQWIVTAYALAVRQLLLLGGKLGDLFGRKWALIAGLVGFSIASAIGAWPSSSRARGARRSRGIRRTARTLGARLLTVTFDGSADRPKAFGIFGASPAVGASLGLILGGAHHQVLVLALVLYVNLVSPSRRRSWRCGCCQSPCPGAETDRHTRVLTSALACSALV